VFVVLDTNHFREVAEATGRAARFRRRAEAERADVFISIITVQEAASGWLALINSLSAGRNQVRGYASFQKTIAAFQEFSILAFDPSSTAWRRSRKKVCKNPNETGWRDATNPKCSGKF